MKDIGPIISQDISKVLKNVYISKFWLGVGGGSHIYISIFHKFKLFYIVLGCVKKIMGLLFYWAASLITSFSYLS